MTHPEKYARPGIYLDEDNHERLIEENREKYRQERLQRLRRKREELDDRIRAEKQRMERNDEA